MISMEKVEKLRKHADISYSEAKKVLEETDGDILEAVVKLEEEGRIKPPGSGGYYNSNDRYQAAGANSEQKQEKQREQQKKQQQKKRSSFAETLSSIIKWTGKIVDKGNTNYFKVLKNRRKILELPLTAFVLLLIFAFWLVIPLIIIGLVVGYNYQFGGPDLEKTEVNKAMDKFSDATKQAVDSVNEAAGKFSSRENNKGANNDGENPDS